VLLNIISNAIKFTESGGSFSISITETQTEGVNTPKYTFVVADTGIGMSEEFVEHVFEPFERERTSTVSGIQGTGLGMAITKNIVEMMGGTISVTSKQSEGSKFTVTIPMKKVTALDDTSTDIQESLQGVKALVLGESSQLCENVCNVLNQAGMHCNFTTLGSEIDNTYQVYILDWLNLDMDVLETVKNIRGKIKEESLLVVLTAYDWVDIESNAKAIGVNKFIPKPLFIADVNQQFESIVHPTTSETTPQGDTCKSIYGQRILLVEDNDLNREIAKEILTEIGLVVEEAEDGNIAIDMLLQKGSGYYQLVLMDIQMPTMDGYTATKTIRAFKDKTLANIPIIAMTANAFEEDKQKAIDAGMNSHLAKPIAIDTLLKTLEDTLSKSYKS
jgi:CheY-like chemotaxis protein